MNNPQWDHIVDNLLSLVPLFYRKFMFHDHKHMPQSHTQVLLLLHEHDVLTVSEIGKRLCISRPNMTPLLNKLIDEDLIHRHNSENDRRVLIVSLTDNGKSFVDQYKQYIMDKMQESFQDIKDNELAKLDESLQTLQSFISKLSVL
ncbi:MarR family winged helix-turn-helix transcriptional regulator [Ectobacillus polymachus]|uniref:MarR family winged helix-turn-helix transcriptional regulator n=1 Tax=Ectobacillus polymachus TaxID=1508806 RepID=UPI003A836974